MSRFICICFALFIVAAGPCGWPQPIRAQAPEEKPVIKQPSLAELAKLYQEFELPLPPKDAKFARVYWGEGGSKGPEKKKILNNLAFCVKGSPPNPSQQIWINFHFAKKIPKLGSDVGYKVEEIFDNPPKPETIQPFLGLDRLLGPKLEGTSSPNEDLDLNRRELIFAIQCHILKYNEIARFYFRRYLNGTKITQEDLKETLVIAAWNYRVMELADPARDRRSTVAILRRIMKDFDFMSDVKRINQGNRHDEFLDLLDLSLQPSKARPGSVEAIIDSLVEGFLKNDYFWWEDTDFRYFWDRDRQIEERKKNDYSEKRSDMEIRLSKLGFDAIPALIDHLDDKRLTRCPWTPDLVGYAGPTFDHNNFETVQFIARQILDHYFEVKISGIEGPLPRDKSGKEITIKEAYLKKWNEVKLKNDLEYLNQSFANNTCETDFSRFIMDKFPERIIPFYKMILDKNCKNQDIDKYIYFIVDSNLQKKEKIELLMLGARHKHFPFQIDALKGLLELESSVFTQSCLESLSGLSKEIQKEKDFIPQIEFPKLALCSGDSKAQATVLEYVKKLPLPAKMKFLNIFITGGYRPSMIHALGFLKQFLDDKQKYQTNENDHEIYESVIWPFTAIEVRNFAACQILEILDIDLSLNDKTTEEEWEKVRAFVKDEVERRVDLEKVK